MLANIIIKRKIPGTGYTEILRFCHEVYDLDKTEKELSWLFAMFKEKNYECLRQEWNFPSRPVMHFLKKLPGAPAGMDWRDEWKIEIESCECDPEEIQKYINTVLVK